MTEPVTDSWLRHTIATLAYRAAKVLRDTPPDFGQFCPAAQSRTALSLVAHLGDLMEWGERMARGEVRWEPVPQTSWPEAVDRFFGALGALDAAVAGQASESTKHTIIFQGPVADALTHVGQLAMMRGLAGSPIRPESYARAQITTGLVGRDQPGPRGEFDGDASPPARVLSE